MKMGDQISGFGNMESSPLDEMKEYVLSFAKKLNLDTGNVLPLKVLHNRARNLNPKQKEALVPAIEALASDGIFDEKDGSYYLTETGRDCLY